MSSNRKNASFIGFKNVSLDFLCDLILIPSSLYLNSPVISGVSFVNSATGSSMMPNLKIEDVFLILDVHAVHRFSWLCLHFEISGSTPVIVTLFSKYLQ